MATFLTTRTQSWSDRMPKDPPPWTTRNGGREQFNVKFGEEEDLPLTYKQHLFPASADVNVDEYLCKDVDRRVAIKIMDTHGNGKVIQAIRQKVELVRRVKHYHSIQVLGSYIHGDSFGMVTQPVAICDLREYLFHQESLKARKVVKESCPRRGFLPRLMGCLAKGLQHIHSREIQDGAQLRHRDIKPANILLKGWREGPLCGLWYLKSVHRYPDRLEREVNEDPNACDICSLGCVYAEIFAVYKGIPAQDFLRYRRSLTPDGAGYFHNTGTKALEKLEGLADERCDVQVVRLIRSMMKPDYKHRPTAEQHDPLLQEDSDREPLGAKYVSRKSGQLAGPIPNNLDFKVHYEQGKGPAVEWWRNLRHWEHSTLDVATILKQDKISKHRHIVKLISTYQHPDMLTLHFEPAAKYDLRTYLELTELRMKQPLDSLDSWKRLQKMLELLRESFGCLSGALAAVHETQYDHGELRPANILVDNNRIFLSKFSVGLKFRGSSATSLGKLFRFIDQFGYTNLDRHGSSRTQGRPQPIIDPEVIQYQPPEWTPEIDEGRPAADIFSLGCVFIEIYRVITGGRVREFEEKRVVNGKPAYRDSVPRTQKLLASFEEGTYETKDDFIGMLCSMIDEDPDKRPEAAVVHRQMAKYKTREGHPRCGSCAEAD
ncbi:MAG: hypothetical protein Q9194_007152 [Teloschistes cf. exilis]